MKFVSVIFLVGCIALVSSTDDASLKEKRKETLSYCQEHFLGATPVRDVLRLTDQALYETSKQFFKCMYEKSEIFSNHAVSRENFLKFMMFYTDEAKANKIADACLTTFGSVDDDNAAFLLHQCATNKLKEYEQRKETLSYCQEHFLGATPVRDVLRLTDQALYETSKPFFKCMYEKSEIFSNHAVSRENFLKFMMFYTDEAKANKIADACLTVFGSVDDDNAAFLLHQCATNKLKEYEQRKETLSYCQEHFLGATPVRDVLRLTDQALYETSKPFFKCMYEKSEIFSNHAVSRENFLKFMMFYTDEAKANKIADACLTVFGSVDDDNAAFLLHQCATNKLKEYEQRKKTLSDCQKNFLGTTPAIDVLRLTDPALYERSKPFFKCIYEKSEIFSNHAVSRENFLKFMMFYTDEAKANKIADACLTVFGSVDDDNAAFLLHQCSTNKLKEYEQSTSGI